jgi:hypothetical protein
MPVKANTRLGGHWVQDAGSPSAPSPPGTAPTTRRLQLGGYHGAGRTDGGGENEPHGADDGDGLGLREADVDDHRTISLGVRAPGDRGRKVHVPGLPRVGLGSRSLRGDRDAVVGQGASGVGRVSADPAVLVVGRGSA